MNQNNPQICILGIGAWATTVANLLAKNGYHPVVWSHEIDLVNQINKSRINSKYLPSVEISKNIFFTTDPVYVIESDLIIQAIPTQFVRRTITNLNVNFTNKFVLNLAKGIEQNTLYRISEIFINDFKLPYENYSILTGPSHAEEVSSERPSAVVVASYNEHFSSLIQKIFHNHYFRVYTSDDVIGCELGGALKNVIAIAAGIIDGLGLGDNSKAALITRSLAEITRLGIALKAKPLTFSGLSGLGDLIVTCNSRYSRNRYVGEKIGEGQALRDILASMNGIAEGVASTHSAFQLSKKHKVEMPITEMVHKILSEEVEPKDAISELMLRKSKPEWWF
ncbi:MAG: NAD(P)H-dependent glycerol-3-phosphate dehydrogenase [Candidatus Kapaibacteriales bacterium]